MKKVSYSNTEGLSQAELMRVRRALAAEIEIPDCANPARREACSSSLARFLETYCMEDGGFLEYPPQKAMIPIIDAVQTAVTSSSWYHVRQPRGTGKTSIVKGGLAYALAYGFRKYIVAVAASGSAASSMIRDVFALFERGDTFAADFPEIAVPIRALDGKTNRARSITVGGKPCNIRVNAQEICLPTVDGYQSSGGILNAVGFSANARGRVRGSLRPDLVVFDDLQDEEMARNPIRVQEAVQNVEKNFLNLGGHSHTIAALMTSTPIEPDDLSETFSARETWHTTTFRLIQSWPDAKETLWEEYRRIRRDERVNGRPPHIAANAFYAAHRAEMDAGAAVLTPDVYDRSVEMSGIQHAMNLYLNGESQFMSEYQMQPTRRRDSFVITAPLILSRVVRGSRPFTKPDGTVFTACATDLNPAYALSTAIVCFDRNLSGFVAAHPIYTGKPIPIRKDIPDKTRAAEIFAALAAHGKQIEAWCRSAGFTLDFWGVDGGGDQFVAARAFALNARQACGISCTVRPMLGRSGRAWNPNVRSRITEARNETVLCNDRDEHGNERNAALRWLAFNADTWRETAQKAWYGEPGSPGALTMYDGGESHGEFAAQVASEILESKYQPPGATRPEYKWRQIGKKWDYGDAVTMCFAAAGAFGISAGGYVKPTTRHVKNVVRIRTAGGKVVQLGAKRRLIK